jgi:photosystem II stability/assembly factor-like uncharacterized protein
MMKNIHYLARIVFQGSKTLPLIFLTAAAMAQTSSVNYDWNSLPIGGFGAIPDIVCTRQPYFTNPDGPHSYFISTDVGTMSRRIAGSSRWNMLMLFLNDSTDSAPDQFGVQFGLSPRGKRIYAQTGKASFPGSERGKMFVSDDGGNTWTQPNPSYRRWSAANFDQVRGRNRISVDPTLADVAYHAAREGLYRTLNGGVNWVQVSGVGGLPNSDTTGVNVRQAASGVAWVVIDQTSPRLSITDSTNSGPVTNTVHSTIWCCVVQNSDDGAAVFPARGVYRSTNGGKNWTRIPGPGGLLLDGWNGEIDNSGNLFMTVSDGNNQGLYRCQAGAAAFAAVTGFNNQFVVGRPARSALSGISIYRGSAGGLRIAVARRWLFGDPPGNPEGNSILVTSNYTTVTGTVWREITNASIQANRQGEPVSYFDGYADPIRDVEFDHGDPQGDRLLFAGYLPYVTDNLFGTAQPTWNCITQGHEETVEAGGAVSPKSGTTRLWSSIGDVGGFRHRTISPTAYNNTFRQFGARVTNTSGIDVSPRNPNVVVMVGRTVHRTTPDKQVQTRRGFYSVNADNAFDGTDNPTFAPLGTAGIPDTAGAGKIALSADAFVNGSKIGGTIVWAPQFLTSGTGGVYHSTNGGTNWSLSSGIPESLLSGDDTFGSLSIPLAADRNVANNFYAYRRGVFYRSTNKGVSFQTIANPLPGGSLPNNFRPYVRCPIEQVAGKNWVGISLDEAGLYLSKDSGGSGTFRRIPDVQRAVSFDFGKAIAGGIPAMYVFGQVNAGSGFKWGLYRSTNGGDDWSAIHDLMNGTVPIVFGNSNANNVYTVVGDKAAAGRVYISTGGNGIFFGQPATP